MEVVILAAQFDLNRCANARIAGLLGHLGIDNKTEASALKLGVEHGLQQVSAVAGCAATTIV